MMEDKKEYLPTVLVIDDDEVNCFVLQKLFEKEGIRSVFAENGSKGMAMSEKERPDLVLLDIFMPGEDGFETLRRLKNDPSLSTIPVFIFSILTDAKMIDKAYAMGAEGYITKPFNMKETVQKVQEILAQKTKGKRDGKERQ